MAMIKATCKKCNAPLSPGDIRYSATTGFAACKFCGGEFLFKKPGRMDTPPPGDAKPEAHCGNCGAPLRKHDVRLSHGVDTVVCAYCGTGFFMEEPMEYYAWAQPPAKPPPEPPPVNPARATQATVSLFCGILSFPMLFIYVYNEKWYIGLIGLLLSLFAFVLACVARKDSDDDSFVLATIAMAVSGFVLMITVCFLFYSLIVLTTPEENRLR